MLLLGESVLIGVLAAGFSGVVVARVEDGFPRLNLATRALTVPRGLSGKEVSTQRFFAVGLDGPVTKELSGISITGWFAEGRDTGISEVDICDPGCLAAVRLSVFEGLPAATLHLEWNLGNGDELELEFRLFLGMGALWFERNFITEEELELQLSFLAEIDSPRGVSKPLPWSHSSTSPSNGACEVVSLSPGSNSNT